jgi:phosphatidylglycerol:prolipoprotein diacylglycerol transferase
MVVRDADDSDPPIPITPIGGLWAFFGGMIGAKMYWILQYSEAKNLYKAFFLWEGGLVFYGGLIGGIGMSALYLHINKCDKWRTADIVAPYIALGEAITRIGCFLNGCCWGRISGLPWAIRYPKGSLAYWQQSRDKLGIPTGSDWSLPIHPTQLYMTLGLILAFVILLWYRKRVPFPGANGLLYLSLYGVVRFMQETFRGDSVRSVVGMSVSQAISLALVVGGITALLMIKNGVICRVPVEVVAKAAPLESPESPEKTE